MRYSPTANEVVINFCLFVFDKYCMYSVQIFAKFGYYTLVFVEK